MDTRRAPDIGTGIKRLEIRPDQTWSTSDHVWD